MNKCSKDGINELIDSTIKFTLNQLLIGRWDNGFYILAIVI